MSSQKGAHLWRTKNGTDWDQVTEDGFGNPDNVGATLIGYRGCFYAVARNMITGIQLMKSFNGVDWTRIGIDGFGSVSNDSWWNSNIVIYNGLPVVSTWNNTSGGEVWQMSGITYLPAVMNQ